MRTIQLTETIKEQVKVLNTVTGVEEWQPEVMVDGLKYVKVEPELRRRMGRVGGEDFLIVFPKESE